MNFLTFIIGNIEHNRFRSNDVLESITNWIDIKKTDPNELFRKISNADLLKIWLKIQADTKLLFQYS